MQHKNDDKKSSKSSSESGTVSKVKSGVALSTGTSTSSFTLERRLSTVNDIKYDMYLMNLVTMLKLYGSVSDRKKNFHLCHQSLLEQGKLTRFEDLPLGSFVIFVSHQWNSFNHPDPNGRQMQVLATVFRDLRDGLHKTESDPFHVLMYNSNTITSQQALYVKNRFFSQREKFQNFDF